MSKKILVVDDEPDLLKVTLLRLKKTGYEVFSGIDGRDVLEIVRRIIPDLVIIDVYLPGLNGDEVTMIMKRDNKLKHIPVILISATTTTLDLKAKECGADGYIIKPFEPEELIGMVKKILGQDASQNIDKIEYQNNL